MASAILIVPTILNMDMFINYDISLNIFSTISANSIEWLITTTWTWGFNGLIICKAAIT